jgi:hypothetical protein
MTAHSASEEVRYEPTRPTILGVWVTVHGIVDAERIIFEIVFPLFGKREIAAVVEDIDLQT